VIRKKGGLLKGFVDSVNVTDNQTGVVRLSSLASCVILEGEGLDPVLQMVTRDRNRIALQSDVLGASALASETSSASAATTRAWATSRRRKASSISTQCSSSRSCVRCATKGVILGGDKLSSMPELFIGAVENPFGDRNDTGCRGLQKRRGQGPNLSRPSASTTWAAFKSS